MLLPIKQIRYVNSVTHEGKVVVFATVESTTKDPKTGQKFTFGKIYYTVRQDGFEDNQDKTDMVGWKHWTLLPFIDEKPDTSVRKKEAEDAFLIESLYRRTASQGDVSQVQVVSHKQQIYVFRTDRTSKHLLVDRFILNGLTNELLPKLEVRYKRSRMKYEANARMKIVNGRLQGVDSLDFRDANDLSFIEPCRRLRFLKNTMGRQFAVVVVPTSDKDIDRWHFFVQHRDAVKGDYVEDTAIRSDSNGMFLLDDQLSIEPAEDENNRPQVRSIPGLISRQFLLQWRHQLGKGLAASAFNIQIEQETKNGPQLLKGATKLLLTFTTASGQLGALSFALSKNGLLSLLDSQVDEDTEMRKAKKKTVFLPINHLEHIQAIGRTEPLPSGSISNMERGEDDLVVIHNRQPHGLNHFDQVTISDTRSYNGLYTITKINDNTFSIEKSWETSEQGKWELLPENANTGLVFEGLITGIKEDGDKVIFTTALDHGLETNLDVLIKNHAVLDGDFEISRLDDHSFAIATKWDPIQVVNLFLEASKRKGLVFDGQGDAIRVQEVVLDIPSMEKTFAHTYSCWVKPGRKMMEGKKLFIGEENGSVLLYVEHGRVHFKASLPEGIYQIHESKKITLDVWSNYAAIIERKTAFEPLMLQLYRNGELLDTSLTFEPNPNVKFPALENGAIQFDGQNSYSSFVLTQAQYRRRDFTIEAWVFPEKMSAKQTIWYKYTKEDGVLSLRRGGSLRLQMGLINRENQFRNLIVDSQGKLVKNEWNHFAVICSFQENKPNTLQWVINGVTEKTVTLIEGLPMFSDGLNILGNDPSDEKYNRHFKGRIGQFRIWKGARSIGDLLNKRFVKRSPKTKGLIVDLLNWPKYQSRVGGEGGNWPAPGEILLHEGASPGESPVQDYSITGFTGEQAYPSYQHTAWSGNFCFGGLAPAKALQLQGTKHLKTRDGKSLSMNFGTDSFTFETWLKTSRGGVLWSVTDTDDDGHEMVKRLSLDDRHLIFDMNGDDDRQAMELPLLFDDQWHFISIRFDRTYTLSDDAVAMVFVDGADHGAVLVNAKKDNTDSQFVLGAKTEDGLDEEKILSLYDTRFWVYLRTEAQIQAAPHFRPQGQEKGLVAYWQFSGETGRDLSHYQHQMISEEPFEMVDCPALQISNTDYSMTGILAEIRIWNAALEMSYLKQTLFVDLIGKEYNLAGNWRLGAIWEEDRRVTDFSTFGNDGQLFGDLYLSPYSVRRHIGSTASSPVAEKYRNEDLVAVSQRAVYEEYFEYRLLDADNNPITNSTETQAPFDFDLRGKRSRTATDWVEHEVFAPQIIAEMKGKMVDEKVGADDKNYGWYQAFCRFLVPDEVALFRVMALRDVKGKWARMELRKFSLTHISDAITKVTYEDNVADLESISDEASDAGQQLISVNSHGQQVVTKRKRISQLDKLIQATKNDANALQRQIDNARTAKDAAQTAANAASKSYNLLAGDPFNYYWKIKVKKSGKYLSIPKRGVKSLNINFKNFTPVRQYSLSNNYHSNVVIEKVNKSQMRMRFADTDYYLSALNDQKNLFFNLDLIKGKPLAVIKGVSDLNFGSIVPKILLTTHLFQAYYNGAFMPFTHHLDKAKSIRNRAFRINVEGTGLALDISAGSTAEGAKCIQWTYNSPVSANQLFYFQIQDADRVNIGDSKRYPNRELVKREDALYAKRQAYVQANERYLQLLGEKGTEGEDLLKKWQQERDQLIDEVNNHYAQISQLQTNYIDAVKDMQSSPQALPILDGNDPNGLLTKGAYLGFIKASDHLSLFENCEGQVQLSYNDHFGRLMQSKYDVTADKQNPYFEEWIPDGPKVALELSGDSYLRPNVPIQLSSEYTLEWWMQCPFAEVKMDDAEHPWWFSILTIDNSEVDHSIPDNEDIMTNGTTFPVISNTPSVINFDENNKAKNIFGVQGINLSLFPHHSFREPFPLGYFDDLSAGWHHFTMVKKGTGRNKEIEIFVDGELRFSMKKFIEEIVEASSSEDKNKMRNLILDSFGSFDDTDSLKIKHIGGLNGAKQIPKPQIAELRLWTLPLDAEEIMTNSKVELSGFEPGLLVYYKMNEGQGTLVRNYAQGNAEFDAEVVGAEKPWVPFAPIIGGVSHKVTFFPTTPLPFQSRARRAVINTLAVEAPKDFEMKHLSFWAKVSYRKGYSQLVSIVQDEINRQDFTLMVNDMGRISINNARTFHNIDENTLFPFGSWVHFALNVNGDEQEVYMNGRLILTSNRLKLPFYGTNQNGKIELGLFRGEMAEFCIRNQALSQEKISLDYNKPINSKDENLLVYLPFNKAGTLDQIINEVDEYRPLIFDSGYSYRMHRAIDVPIVYPNVICNEYSTIGLDPETGQKNAMMRRFLCVPTSEGAGLFSNKRIEELQLLWIGNAQFKPTLLGYMEGAPPVPSENFTIPDNLDGYRGATSVSLDTSEDTEYNWTREQDVSAGFDLELFLGAGGDIAFNAPFLGRIKIAEFKGGFQGALSFAYSFLNSSSITASSSNITTDQLSLTGSPEEKPKFEHLGKRFIPKNVGYALVVSGLADVYVLRLKRSKKMVSYSVQANEDLPMDINTITFLINPAYTMNGSLDGQTGTQATSQRYFRQVPEMRAQYGSLYPASYFRLHEAYDLKQQIENEDKRRAAYFENFNSLLVDETSLDRNVDNEEFDPGAISVNQDVEQGSVTDEEGGTLSQQEQMEQAGDNQAALEEDANNQAEIQKEEGKKRQKEIQEKIANQDQKANASYQLARWQKKMEDLQIRASKRNIVNTYVWDADGGLRTETQEFSNAVEHTIGGSVSMDAALGGKAEGEIGFFAFELSALATVSLTQTLTKTSTNSKGFALNVDLSGVEGSGITDYDDNPILPGEKVDRYRFMSFYLEGSTKNFHDFFNYVVDQEWLMSNDEEARALRQTQAGTANAAWRILHRVTYVERPALKGFGKDVRPQLKLSPPEVDSTEEILGRLRALEQTILEGSDDNEALRKEVADLIKTLNRG